MKIVRCRIVRLDSGGYVRKGQDAPHGMYYGHGERLYSVEAECGCVNITRAPDRDAAMARLSPLARLFRHEHYCPERPSLAGWI